MAKQSGTTFDTSETKFLGPVKFANVYCEHIEEADQPTGQKVTFTIPKFDTTQGDCILQARVYGLVIDGSNDIDVDADSTTIWTSPDTEQSTNEAILMEFICVFESSTNDMHYYLKMYKEAAGGGPTAAHTLIHVQSFTDSTNDYSTSTTTIEVTNLDTSRESLIWGSTESYS